MNTIQLSKPHRSGDIQVRSKRLAKLGAPSPSPSATQSTSTTPPPSRPQPATKPKLQPVVKSPPTPVASTSAPSVRKAPVGPARLDIPAWEHETVGQIFGVTLDVSHCQIYEQVAHIESQRQYAEQRQWKPVWLKQLQQELESEQPGLCILAFSLV